MKLKPFSLEEAKAGKAIVCRDETPAKFVAHVPEADAGYRVVTFRGGKIFPSCENGLTFPWQSNHDGLSGYSGDLFMATEIKTVWLNIYESDRFNDHHDGIETIMWDTKARADGNTLPKKRIACAELTYTEGDGL